ncbi:DNA uptake protein ComE-like DNA-binding protein [Tumebacillus sp. BK434]|uniref:ComEA family DNA-binding protein n=1 Tax=Tumebacillus sp. BK434 TaxID=2512169 RepID=UPI001045432F|nr:helix-hairpin-helix domain-containing protein [Tumebacillus sp. BK434]TCP57613.1 DNA uptake protein ComE-like DNA-binding protein [Tumebacillus sp. BK434]
MASITPKGSAWEWGKSLWMIWTLPFGMLTWISFWYIAFRTKQKKWAFWGVVYFAATVFFFAYADAKNEGSLLGELAVPVILLTWVVGIFHARLARKEYLLRIVALSQLKGRNIEELKNQIELEYDVDIDAVNQSKKLIKAVESKDGAQRLVKDTPEEPARAVAAQTAASAAPAAPGAELEDFSEEDLAEATKSSIAPPVTAERGPEGPVDINNDPKERIASLPKVGIVLAMKAVSIRETQGAFRSVEHFVEAVGLKPHVAEQLRDHIVIGPKK